MDKPWVYEIQVEGALSRQWMDWFDGLEVRVESDGTTLLRGLLIDQAALLGVLNKINSLNLILVSLCRKPEQSHP